MHNNNPPPKVLGMIHPYPSEYLFDSLQQDGWQVALICPQQLAEAAILQHPALIDVSLCDFAQPAAVVSAAITSHQALNWQTVLPVNEGCVTLTAMVAAQLGLAGNSVPAAEASRDKASAYSCFTTANIAHPQSRVVNSLAQAMAVCDEISYPCILKLADSMNSQGVIRVNNSDEYHSASQHLFSLFAADNDFNRDRNVYAYGQHGAKVLIQPFCRDEEIGIDLLYRHGEAVVLGIFEKCPSQGPYFAEMYSVFPSSLDDKTLSAACELAKKALFALGATVGAAHVEIRFDQGKPYVLEVGLRPGGGYTAIACEQLSGINTYRALAALLTGAPLPQPMLPIDAAVLYGGILYQQSGILRQVRGMDYFEQLPGLADLVTLAVPGDRVMTMPHAAQPHYAYYLLTGDKRETLLHSYQQIQQRVSLDIEEHHHD